MISSEMVQYWDQVTTWIESQRVANPSPTVTDTNWTKFPYTTFLVTQALNPNIEHENLADTTTYDGVVFVVITDSDEELLKDRGAAARKDISIIITYQRHVPDPTDLNHLRQCINTVQALKDCCRRFKFNGIKKSYMGSEPERDQIGQTIPWLGMRAENTFHAIFTVRYANYLVAVDAE